ncbi:hypothetical protein BDC45DRAFT_216770 [Circinella umbellata]|nr:hypothetical protein BDC45DRAFT_216770 [Circinella umbellata]
MSFTLESKLANKVLNGFFENASYVKGAEASDADKAVFEALPEGPSAAEYPHLARWYNHIAAVQGLNAKYVYLLFLHIYFLGTLPFLPTLRNPVLGFISFYHFKLFTPHFFLKKK